MIAASHFVEGCHLSMKMPIPMSRLVESNRSARSYVVPAIITEQCQHAELIQTECWGPVVSTRRRRSGHIPSIVSRQETSLFLC